MRKLQPSQTPTAHLTTTPFRVAVALAAVALACPAAFAAAAVPEVAMSGYSLSSGQAHSASLAVAPPALLDATAPALPIGQTLSATRPLDASTGLFLAGPVSFTINGSSVTLRVADVINETTATSGTLTLDLIATTTPPPVGAINGAFVLASTSLPTLAAGSERAVNVSGLAFSGPSAGCYYLSLLLLENGDVADVRTFPAGGTPEPTGYSEFGFGESCPAETTCTRTATNVCLNSGRFMVTVAYDNTTTGAGVGQVLLFGSTRAESDESGFFYFTDASNFELGAKVLDACSINNAFWVFIGGLTNQGWSLNVLDTQTSNVKFYGNADGTTTVTTTDTTALPCP
jgi:hypothetical protein